MPDLTAQHKITRTPLVMDYTRIGTAAGTTTISTESCFVQGIQVTRRKASGVFTLYDSVGTSLTPIGTITMGTNTADDPPYIPLGFRTNSALTIVNDADFGGIVSFGR